MKYFDKLIQFIINVNDMEKAKEFYVNKLGFNVTKDFRQDDQHWWVSLELPGGGTFFTLTTFHEGSKPGGMTLYVSSPDIEGAYKLLKEKGAAVTSEINDDLYGPRSGVKWFSVEDPDGNTWMIAEA